MTPPGFSKHGVTGVTVCRQGDEVGAGLMVLAPSTSVFCQLYDESTCRVPEVRIHGTGIWLFPKIMVPSKSSILIGFSIMFTIHVGVPLFLETPIHMYLGKLV